MTRNDPVSPADHLVGPGDCELVCELDERRWAAIKAHLRPGEYVVWAEGGHPAPLPSIRIFPAFFASVLMGSSGFALMVLFGIYGLRPMDLEGLVLMWVAPAAIGGMTAIGVAWGMWRHYGKRRRVSRSFYVLTDRRALVGSDAPDARDALLGAWTRDTFDDTLCIEHGDGTGDVYFVVDGEVTEPELGLVGIRHPGRVAVRIEEILLNRKAAWEEDL